MCISRECSMVSELCTIHRHTRQPVHILNKLIRALHSTQPSGVEFIPSHTEGGRKMDALKANSR